jgi:hypothetical protein
MNALLNTTLATLQTISSRNKNSYIDAATLASICLATATLVEALKDQVTDLEDQLSKLTNPKSITAASVAGGVLSLTITGHGFAAGTSGYATISGLAGNVTIDGVRELTYVNADTMSCVVTGLTTISDQAVTQAEVRLRPAPKIELNEYNNIMSQVISEASKIRRYFD